MSADSSSRDSSGSAKSVEKRDNPGPSRAGLARQTLELLLPSTCRLCDRCVASGIDFCEGCRLQLQSSEHLMRSACARCGRPGAGPELQNDPGSVSDGSVSGCQQCARETLHFDRCIALWTYDGLVRNAVVASKYGSQVALADALGQRLGQQILSVFADEPDVDHPGVVTSVPSHLWRRVQRGSGGSRVLAHSVAQTVRGQWPEVRQSDLLAATRRIRKQAWLGEKERMSNVRGAFRVTKPGWRSRKRPWLAGKHVLLIDDVMTTGATAGENARVLKAAGAHYVTVAIVARAFSG